MPSPTPTMISLPAIAMLARLVIVTVVEEPPLYGIVNLSSSMVMATTEEASQVASTVYTTTSFWMASERALETDLKLKALVPANAFDGTSQTQGSSDDDAPGCNRTDDSISQSKPTEDHVNTSTLLPVLVTFSVPSMVPPASEVASFS